MQGLPVKVYQESSLKRNGDKVNHTLETMAKHVYVMYMCRASLTGNICIAALQKGQCRRCECTLIIFLTS